MNTNPNYIIKAPMLTEESTIQRDTKGQYTFKVDPRANKRQIQDAIEKLFNVKVVSVNTCNYVGKQSGRRGRARPGFRPAWKKAIVTLRRGDTIDII